MNIGSLSKLIGVTTDTVRFYEKQGLLAAPQRSANGYRTYDDADIAGLRFVRSAQALGFSLSEIRSVAHRLAAGEVGRADIEANLQKKISEIDAQIRKMRTLKQELLNTIAALECPATGAVSIPDATSRKAPCQPSTSL